MRPYSLDDWELLRVRYEHSGRRVPYYGTADVDLDSSGAIAAAGELLPETGTVFGRQSKPRSHYFYRSDPPIRSKRFLDPRDKGCLVELRVGRLMERPAFRPSYRLPFIRGRGPIRAEREVGAGMKSQ